MERRWKRVLTSLAFGAAAGIAAGASGAAAAEPQAIIKERCQTCHVPTADGGWNRISEIRKSPEGWEMTLFRMNHVHKAGLSEDEARTLVKHLADTQGLAPSETADYRYILERKPHVQEADADAQLVETCARCHSVARVALQRRDAEEWNKLAHFHLGQFPSAEYQLFARDRNWWQIISQEMPPKLGERFPFKTAAWDAWAKAPKVEPVGTWRLFGTRPGVGTWGGSMTVSKAADGTYAVKYDLTGPDGKQLSADGSAVVYTGYEWRGTVTLDGVPMRAIMALSEDGASLKGRLFEAKHDERGSTVVAVKADGAARPLGMSATAVKVGTTTRVTLWGENVKGLPDFGPGTTVTVVSQAADHTVLDIAAAAKAAPGPRDMTLGKAVLPAAITVYDRIDSVRVEPELAVGRVGGNGGTTETLAAQFETVGYLNGPDGKPGTEDDQRIGTFPATWATAPNDAAAEAMQDVKFAGEMRPNGLFMPAVAGPNAQRTFGTNNVGDLKVTATVQDGKKTVSGDGRLVVTVQRWNDPPIH
ncbi:quinohemoprotein amine dehydrogenase subunit alpha [Novispirillum sp. DQ9]|uniref:quinohemoprotein amine dehydrogenase subunit alpha n=1 Tax=Novispirillum sp. DQ9 TaxID=3398612 RepID=UPI003C79FF8E